MDNILVNTNICINHDTQYHEILIKYPKFIWRKNFMHICSVCNKEINNEKIRLEYTNKKLSHL